MSRKTELILGRGLDESVFVLFIPWHPFASMIQIFWTSGIILFSRGCSGARWTMTRSLGFLDVLHMWKPVCEPLLLPWEISEWRSASKLWSRSCLSQYIGSFTSFLQCFRIRAFLCVLDTCLSSYAAYAKSPLRPNYFAIVTSYGCLLNINCCAYVTALSFHQANITFRERM